MGRVLSAAPHLVQQPVGQLQYPVHAVRQLDVVRCNQRCDASPPDQRNELMKYPLRRLGIEVAGRLVRQQQAR